ncbi:hypothetical protein WMY93_023565 [Mugilogobius chulae]|uniref:Ras-related protein Rab n=1 Tax=Mugilogobius chulae TaxID=88201 RepID=A0AAW0NGS2_9GOBI
MEVCTDHLFKVLVIGDKFVGKTSIVLRYVKKSFSPNYKTTLGVDFMLKTIQLDPRTVVRLQFWDIAGQERTRNLSRVFFKEAKGALVVFDASDCNTLESAAQWKRDLDSKVTRDNGQPIPALLLANKCDLLKQRDRDSMAPTLDDFCRDNHFTGWFETSAKEDINIQEVGSFLVDRMITNSSTNSRRKKDVIKAERGSDHCKRNNHIMDWDGARVIGSENNKYKRWIKEAIEIRKRGTNSINRDDGAFLLSHTWDTLLQRPPGDRRRGQSDRRADHASRK